MTRLFDLDLQLIADAGLMIIAVFVLFLLASYLFFNPVREMLKNRQDKIKGELDDAAAALEEASAGAFSSLMVAAETPSFVSAET